MTSSFSIKRFMVLQWLTYPLAAMAVDEGERECIQTPVLPIIVQKLGLNRNLPVAVTAPKNWAVLPSFIFAPSSASKF
jgi:hypothetical protein